MLEHGQLMIRTITYLCTKRLKPCLARLARSRGTAVYILGAERYDSQSAINARFALLVRSCPWENSLVSAP